jgi:type I restriction enzyme S subunit
MAANRKPTDTKIATDHQKLVSKLNPWFSRVVFASDNKDTICSTEFVVWQPKIASMKCYLYQIAIHPHFIAYSTQNATGTSNSHKRVNPKVMMKYKVAFNEEFAISYSKRMRQFIQQMQNNQKQNQKLSELRDWLLPMLMNGQVRVSDKLSASGFSGFRDGQDLGMVAEEGGEYGS